ARAAPPVARPPHPRHGSRPARLWHSAADLDRPLTGPLPQRTDRLADRGAHRAPRLGRPGLGLPPRHLDGAPQSRGVPRLRPKKDGVEALIAAGASTPPPAPDGAAPGPAPRGAPQV